MDPAAIIPGTKATPTVAPATPTRPTGIARTPLAGRLNQAVLVALALAIVAMVFWGYRMWCQRRPTRGHTLRFGRPACRGAWRTMPRWAFVALPMGAVAVGLFLPVWGVSLVILLLIDVVVGLLRGRQDATGGTTV